LQAHFRAWFLKEGEGKKLRRKEEGRLVLADGLDGFFAFHARFFVDCFFFAAVFLFFLSTSPRTIKRLKKNE